MPLHLKQSGSAPALAHSPAHQTAAAGPWREPLMWLVVGIPALTVVAGVITLIIAMSGNDRVLDRDLPHRKDGLAISAPVATPAMQPPATESAR